MKTARSAWILRNDGPQVEIWGLSASERLRRSLLRAGCAEVLNVNPEAPPRLGLEGRLVLLRGDVIFDARRIAARVEGPERGRVA